MQDAPSPAEILTTVAAFLRDVVATEGRPRTAFQARVAANAVDLVRRQIELGEAGDRAERARLVDLLGADRSLEEGNVDLARRIAAGEMGTGTPGLIAHLRATTLAKLAVDQPSYSGYRAALPDAPATKD